MIKLEIDLDALRKLIDLKNNDPKYVIESPLLAALISGLEQEVNNTGDNKMVTAISVSSSCDIYFGNCGSCNHSSGRWGSLREWKCANGEEGSRCYRCPPR